MKATEAALASELTQPSRRGGDTRTTITEEGLRRSRGLDKFLWGPSDWLGEAERAFPHTW